MNPVINQRRKVIEKILTEKQDEENNVIEFGDKFYDNEWIMLRAFSKYFKMWPNKEAYRMVDEALIDASYRDYKESFIRDRI